jgi:thiol-disulfide isomerase/thioredoxin
MDAKRLMAAMIVGMMIGSGLGIVSGSMDSSMELEPVINEIIEQPKPLGGSSPKTVLIEQFTADWCLYCPPQSQSIERLIEEYKEELGDERLVALEMHGSSTCHLYNSQVDAVEAFYTVAGVPTVIFDGGGNWANGTLRGSGGTSKFGVYTTDNTKINYVINSGAPLTMSVTGDLMGNEGTIHTVLDFTDTPSESNLQLKVVIAEDGLYHLGDETYAHHRVYNKVARNILATIDLPSTLISGTHLEYNQTFTLNPAWFPSMDPRRMSIVAYVQSTNSYGYRVSGTWYYNHPVMQSTSYDFVEPKVLIVNADDTDVIDNGVEHFPDEMVKIGGVPYCVWDTMEPTDSTTLNARTMPTAAQMSGYETVLWYTGLDTTTLTATHRAELQTYLNDGGNVWLEGAYIAEDANTNGWNAWLQTNFGASYLSANTGATSINGVAADPIGNGLSGLTIHATSPDGITAFGSNAAASFTYNTGQTAAVRANHAGGGHTYFSACNYFLSQDTEGRVYTHQTVMRRSLNWTDVASPPTVTVNNPNGGETLTPGSSYEINWFADDVWIPSTGIDIYYCTDYPTATWQPIVADTVNDGVYMWTVPSVNSATCRVRVVATDSQGLTGEDFSNANFTIGTGGPAPDNYDIPLAGKTAGQWVFVSFPIAISGNIQTILNDATLGDGLTTWDVAKWYDGQTNVWKSYRATGTQTLTTINNQMGVWLHLLTNGGDQMLTTSQTGDYSASAVTINLYLGWNLVGYPSATSRAESVTLPAEADFVAVWQSTTPFITDHAKGASMMVEGNAYWVRVTADCVWTVQP